MNEKDQCPDGQVSLEEVLVVSACAALREMMALEVLAEREVAQVRIPTGAEWLCASIELARQEAGELRIWFDEETAGRLALSYLGGEFEFSPAIGSDFAGELANVIAGQAKTRLKGTEHHFQMTLPHVRRAGGHEEFNAIGRIDTELGSLWIELAVPSRS